VFKLYHEQCLARLQQHVGYHHGTSTHPTPTPGRVV
jgi:hypothetical protein